jgi:hypothetical protein
MNSFYGGPNGQSFELSEIFRSKTEMEVDLQRRWQSTIAVGDYVFIAYGLPSDPDGTNYDSNRDKDIKKYNGKTYNSTLWQKIYTENDITATDKLTGIETIYASSNYGLGYRLIGSFTGNTPRFSQNVKTTVLPANETPSATIDSTDVDNPILYLNLPHSYEFLKGEVNVEVLNADGTPAV